MLPVTMHSFVGSVHAPINWTTFLCLIFLQLEFVKNWLTIRVFMTIYISTNLMIKTSWENSLSISASILSGLRTLIATSWLQYVPLYLNKLQMCFKRWKIICKFIKKKGIKFKTLNTYRSPKVPDATLFSNFNRLASISHTSVPSVGILTWSFEGMELLGEGVDLEIVDGEGFSGYDSPCRKV